MSERFRNYEHHSGRKARVKLEKLEEKGHGAASEVRAARIEVKRGKEKRILDSLFVKEYKEPHDRDGSIKEMVKVSLKNYALLKRLHFPVPPTYRMDVGKDRILMTNVNVLHPDSISLTTSQTVDAEDFNLIEIPNFEEIAREIVGYVEVAAENYIDISADAYNITVPRSGKGNAKLFFTDLELMEESDEKSQESRHSLLKQNLEQAQVYLCEYIVGQYVPEELRAPYFESLAALFKEKKLEHGVAEDFYVDEELKKYL